MLIHRFLYNTLQRQLEARKIILLTGAGQVGKTVLLNQLANTYSGPKLMLNGEDTTAVQLLNDRSVSAYQHWLGDTKLLLIDQAQAIPDIRKALKFLIDSFPNLTILLASSSAFEISDQTNKPLIEPQRIHTLFPLAQLELGPTETYLQTRQRLEERLIFGSYPDVVQTENVDTRANYLISLVSSRFLEDIQRHEQVRNAQKMLQLLQLVAYRVGSEVSYDELSDQLQIDRNTVVRYLELFANVFILFRLGGYSNNLRKEVTKSSKWYFFDNGIRNAVINNFSSLLQRHDVDTLWENYVASERLKRNAYLQSQTKAYFWRTYDHQKLDWVEEINGQLNGYEFKWRTNRTRFPKGFQKAYPYATLSAISPENYLDFITPNYFNV